MPTDDTCLPAYFSLVFRPKTHILKIFYQNGKNYIDKLKSIGYNADNGIVKRIQLELMVCRQKTRLSNRKTKTPKIWPRGVLCVLVGIPTPLVPFLLR